MTDTTFKSSFPRKNVTPYHVRGGNPSSATAGSRVTSAEPTPIFIPRWQPAWLIAMKIGHGKPVVGATLVVARSRRQPVFIPLCGLRNAMVILRSAATKNLQSLPRRADRGRQNEIATMIRFLPSCHWYENDRHNLQFVIPAKERHPVPRYGAGIHLRPLPAAE